MPLDPEVSDLLKMEGMAGTRESARLSGVVDRNLVQGLGVINSTLIQQHGGTADDAAQMAALRTAIHIPIAQPAPIQGQPIQGQQ
jgi:hypothetical protein